VILVGLSLTAATPASADVGFRDFSYGSTVTAPTGQKPESKLWWTSGGTWWGVMWSTAAKAWTIQKFDKATGKWSDTGVVVDSRRTASPDALWDGSTLYIASSLFEGSTQTDARVLVYRFSFNGSTWSSLGAPETITNGKPETLVIDKDSTGKLWLTYTADNGLGGKTVYVAHTTTSQTTWGTPYVLPVPDADHLAADDISTLVSYGASGNRYIGVLYSNQNDETLSFARHPDGAGDAISDWQRIVLASGTKLPDDHLNIKSLIDSNGRVFAVVKTSLNDKSPQVPSDPLIVLYTITGTSASASTVWTVGDDVTRAILMLDSENQNVHLFGAGPCCSGGTVYTKSSGYNSPTFAAGRGAPFIQLASDPKINNVTSAKQTVNSTSGLLVEAGDDSTRFYVHNFLTLADSTPPDTTIASGPSGTVTATSADFSFSSSEAGSTFECSLDGAAFAPCTSPKSYTALTSGAHTFKVQAKDAALNTDPTPATQTWTIETPADTTAPDTTIVSGPSGTVPETSADFGFSSSEAGSTFECSLDGAALATCTSPKSYTALTSGAHTFKVQAKDAALNTDPTPAVQTWTIASTPPATLFSDGFESGTLGAWQVTTGGNGTVAAQTTTVKTGTFAARLAETTSATSFAYARRPFATPLTDFTVTGDFNVTQEGASGGNVPQLRLLDASGARVMILYRQNATTGGQLWVSQNGTRVNTTGGLPLGQWRNVELRVKIAGAASIVQVKVNGAQVYTTSTANLGTSGITRMQLGNDTAAQQGTIAVDNVSVRTGA
jgi:hypothetical protein